MTIRVHTPALIFSYCFHYTKGLQTHQGHGAANALVEASTCIHVSAGCGLAHDLYPKQLAASLAWLDPSCTSKLQALLQVCSTDTSQSSSSERNEVMVAVQWPPAPMQAGLTPVTHVLRMVVACWPPDGLQPQRIELWSPTPGSLRNKERVLVVQHLPCAVSVPPPATPTPQTTPAAVPTVGSDAEGLPLRRVKAPASKGNAPFLPTMWHRRARRASAPNATSQAAAALAMLFAQESHPLSSSGRGRTSATHTLSSRTTDTTHKTPSWAAALHVAEAIPLEKPDQERVATQILTRSRLPSRINSGNGSQPHGLPPQQALDGLAMEALPIIVTIIDFGAPSRQVSRSRQNCVEYAFWDLSFDFASPRQLHLQHLGLCTACLLTAQRMYTVSRVCLHHAPRQLSSHISPTALLAHPLMPAVGQARIGLSGRWGGGGGPLYTRPGSQAEPTVPGVCRYFASMLAHVRF